MFASQLLRILETIPGDINHEICDFDKPEVNLNMKDNQNGILCHPNGFKRETDPLVFGLLDGHESWNASVCDRSEAVDRTYSDDGEARDSQMAGDQEGLLCHSNGCKKGLQSLDDKSELSSSPEFQRSIIVDSFHNHDENESRDSEEMLNTVLKLFGSGSETHFYTDKIVQKCEFSELKVDICVDEGLPTHIKTVIELDKVGHAYLFVSQHCGEDEHSGTIGRCHDIEHSPDESEVSTVEDTTEGASNECGTKEEEDIGTISLDRPKPSIEDYAGKEASIVFCAGNLTRMGEANESTTERTVDDVSEYKIAISTRHSSQDSVVQDSQLYTSNSDGNKAPKQLDEVPSVEAILESLVVAFTAEDSKKNGTASSSRYNSKVESGTITFDFKSSKPDVDSGINGSAENGHAEFIKSEDVHSHSATTPVESASIVDMNENIHEPKTQPQDAANYSRKVHCVEEESIFLSSGPVSGPISYSGPIPYSGSLSLRSDSSTTSTRSFAFPILHSEWNSSPVRMAKADRRLFKKHRGWKQGLFCCRF